MTELEGLEGLGELGRVDPPAPGVLDSARELLWSAVAAEMLATSPDAAHGDAAHRDAEEPGREPRRADPGAP